MDQEIRAALDKIESKKKELDTFRDKFIDDCKMFAHQEFDEKIQSAIGNNPDKVKGLGSEGIAPIKQEIEIAKEALDSFVGSILKKDEIWLYKQAELTPENSPFHTYRVNGNRLPDIIEESVRLVLSSAGQILVRHDIDKNEQWEASGQYMRYRYGLSASQPMKDSLNAFSEKFDELFRLLETLKSQKRERERHEAIDLWNKS